MNLQKNCCFIEVDDLLVIKNATKLENFQQDAGHSLIIKNYKDFRDAITAAMVKTFPG